jgi:elongation factor Ts
MANITASDVNKLRQQTGAGMMDCKKALVEAEGDFESAIEILRKKGQKVAAKRGDNEASEGLAVALTNGANGVIVRVNCETDFVAKNSDFADFVTKIAQIALDKSCISIEELKKQAYDTISVEEKVIEQIGKIGEKIEIAELALINASSVVAYNHPGNQVASLIGLSSSGDSVTSAGRDVAMQVAAMMPIALDRDGVSAEIIEKEIEIGKELARQEGKPEDMLEKIALGRLNKFYKESVLLEQAFIKDQKLSVKDYLNSVEKGLTITEYKRFALK